MSTNPEPELLTVNQFTGHLGPMTGMPPNNVSRSRELNYDALELNIRFIKNPYGPRPIYLSRNNQHW